MGDKKDGLLRWDKMIYCSGENLPKGRKVLDLKRH